MRINRLLSKKALAVSLAVGVTLGVGGAAYAYLTTTGSGSGSATGGTAATLTIVAGAPAATIPGGPAVPIPYTINNPNGNGAVNLGVVEQTPATSIVITNGDNNLDIPPCDPSWFTVTAAGAAVGTIANNTTFTSGSPVTNEPTISEASVAENQDNCVGATITVSLTAVAGS